jgi:hypothetical protein
MPATRPEKLPPINVGAWLRVGARIQGTDPSKLDDQSMDTIYGELHAGGKIHKNVSVTLNLNANGLAKGAGIMDAIVGFDICDPFHVWVGQLLVPADRANGSGPFFMIPWNYPGFYSVPGAAGAAVLPAEGPSGRNAGVVIWGDVMDGMFKYMAGAFNSKTTPATATSPAVPNNAADPTATPLYSGRLQLALLAKEPGFWGNGSYFGEKDVLSIGVSGQAQKALVGPNYGEFGADALAEFKVGGGWVTGEVVYYHFTQDNAAFKNSVAILGAFASPTVGVGNIQPMVRYQVAKGEGITPTVSAVDVALSYLVKGPALRAVATFQHVDLGNDVIGNSIQLGAQAIFF